jgi:hypothetical protein
MALMLWLDGMMMMMMMMSQTVLRGLSVAGPSLVASYKR